MSSSAPDFRKVDAGRLVQNRSQTPICRVHVYGTPSVVQQVDDYAKSARLPLHWCGINPPGNETPDAVFGKNGSINKQIQGTHYVSYPNPWSVLSCRVNLTRQWNCSSANIQIACPVKNKGEVYLPPIRPNDVIVIEMGYVPSPSTVVALKGGQTMYLKGNNGIAKGFFEGDTVFFGVVDTVKERGGSGGTDGIVFTIQARDCMRYLADNKIRSNYQAKTTGLVDRALVIRDFLYIGSAIDNVIWKNNGVPVGGKASLAPDGTTPVYLMREPDDGGKPGTLKNADFGPGNTYIRLGLIEKSSRADQIAPEVPGAAVDGIRIMDKFTLEVVKHFSMVESTPRELYADHQDGTINWLTRRTDGIKLYNPDINESARRQYFYRYPPDRANVLSYTNEWSTVGTINHFVLTNPLAGSSAGSTKGSMDLYAESPHAMLKDPHVANSYLRVMTRNRFIYDDSLTQNDSAQAIVGSLFNIYGRALETGMVMVPGDPTLTIGEAVQIFNMGLFGRRTFKGQTDQQGKDATAIVDGTYEDIDYNPTGIQRVEALSQLFCVGGIARGFVTVFVFGPADDETGVIYTTLDSMNGPTGDLAHIKDIATANGSVVTARLLKTQDDMKQVIANCLTVEQLEDVGNIVASAPTATPAQAQDNAAVLATRAEILKKFGV